MPAVGRIVNPVTGEGYHIIILISGKIRFVLQKDFTASPKDRIIQDSVLSLSSGVWANFIMTYDNSLTAAGVKFFLNGVAIDTTIVEDNLLSAPSGVLDFIIGSNGLNAGGFNGNLDEIGVWSKELTSMEVIEIYNSGIPDDLLNHSANADLISFWRCGDEATFTTDWAMPDQKGSNDGTSVNMEVGDRKSDTI